MTNETIYNKLVTLYKGYKERKLNLNEFIGYNNLDMILNNDLIQSELDFELYNYSELLEIDIKEKTEYIKEDLENLLINGFDNNKYYELTDIIDNYSGLATETENIINDYNIKNMEDIENFINEYLM